LQNDNRAGTYFDRGTATRKPTGKYLIFAKRSLKKKKGNADIK